MMMIAVLAALPVAACGVEPVDGEVTPLTVGQGKADGQLPPMRAHLSKNGATFLFHCDEPIFDRKCNLTLTLEDWPKQPDAATLTYLAQYGTVNTRVIGMHVGIADTESPALRQIDVNPRVSSMWLTWNGAAQQFVSYSEGARPQIVLKNIPNGDYHLRLFPAEAGEADVTFRAQWD